MHEPSNSRPSRQILIHAFGAHQEFLCTSHRPRVAGARFKVDAFENLAVIPSILICKNEPKLGLESMASDHLILWKAPDLICKNEPKLGPEPIASNHLCAWKAPDRSLLIVHSQTRSLPISGSAQLLRLQELPQQITSTAITPFENESRLVQWNVALDRMDHRLCGLTRG